MGRRLRWGKGGTDRALPKAALGARRSVRSLWPRGYGGVPGVPGGPRLSVAPRSVSAVNRTDRLYALVEALRAIAPRHRSARELAARFEVSVRTIERDITALQESGVPIYAEPGRKGGYAIDKKMS